MKKMGKNVFPVQAVAIWKCIIWPRSQWFVSKSRFFSDFSADDDHRLRGWFDSGLNYWIFERINSRNFAICLVLDFLSVNCKWVYFQILLEKVESERDSILFSKEFSALKTDLFGRLFKSDPFGVLNWNNALMTLSLNRSESLKKSETDENHELTNQFFFFHGNFLVFGNSRFDERREQLQFDF